MKRNPPKEDAAGTTPMTPLWRQTMGQTMGQSCKLQAQLALFAVQLKNLREAPSTQSVGVVDAVANHSTQMTTPIRGAC